MMSFALMVWVCGCVCGRMERLSLYMITTFEEVPAHRFESRGYWAPCAVW